MNNYPNFKNFSNYINSNTNMNPMSYNMSNIIDSMMNNNMNNNMNMNMYNKQEMMNDNFVSDKSNKLYDPYNGLIRGNLFKNLYEPYKIKEPYEIKPMNEQADLLTYIDALSFAMIDLNLYLDIYPNDKNVIDLYNQYRKEKESMMNEYESKYGPITLNSDSLNSYPWSWDDMPWPWDN